MADESGRLRALTARETIALPEPDEGDLLLGPYVVRGGRTIIAGASGHGKTALSLAMLGAILTGRDFLDQTGAGVGPVLVFDLEQGLRSVKRMLREAGLARRDDLYVVRAPDGLALDADDGADLAEVEAVIAEIQPVALLLDPYYKAYRGEPNEERPVTDLMRRLDALRERHGFAILLPAHARKDVVGASPSRKLALDDVSGSGAVTRGAEVVLGIERYVHGFARLRVLKDRDGDLIVGDAFELTYSKEVGFRLRQEEDLEAKLQAVGADGQWRTAKEWARDAEIREKTARGILEALTEAGLGEFALGPEGRSPRARCWRMRDRSQMALDSAADAGAVGSSGAVRASSDGTAPTAPVFIETQALGAVAVAPDQEPEQSAPDSNGPGAVPVDGEPEPGSVAWFGTARLDDLERALGEEPAPS
jgi:hypothetical protein